MTFTRPDIIRPPSEARSYFLPLTAGCSNNTCIFCNYYGSRLKIRDAREVKQEIEALQAYVNTGLQVSSIPDIVYYIARHWDGRRVFLQDGDALVYPYTELKEVLAFFNEKFPHLERIGTYATPRDLLRRSVSELEELARLKLGIVYMGVETGDAELLKQIGKGVNYGEMVEAGRKAKEAGILLSVTVILGLGGVEGSERHAVETARILTEIDPDYAGALTLTLVPGTPLYDRARKGEFCLVSPFRSLEELKLIVEEAKFTNCFFSSMHASNYVAVRGRLPQEKEKMLGQLEAILASKDPSLLRPEHYRGL